MAHLYTVTGAVRPAGGLLRPDGRDGEQAPQTPFIPAEGGNFYWRFITVQSKS